jgi:hypothetical protein
MCIDSERFATRLYHTQLQDVESDQQLLMRLRAEYQKIRGSVLNFFSVKAVNAIHFVQVRYHTSTRNDHQDPELTSFLKSSSYDQKPWSTVFKRTGFRQQRTKSTSTGRGLQR